MKTTLYVALERLIDMQDPSSWKLDRALSASIRSHQAECTVVAVFAPHRFGLIFESREETEDAWRYIYGWLRRKGLSFEDRFVLLRADADASGFTPRETGWWLANDADMSADVPNLRLIRDLPSRPETFAGRLRRLFAAVLF